jgi:hypothetical protein
VSYSSLCDISTAEPNQTYALAWNFDHKQNQSDLYLYDLNADGTVNIKDLKMLTKNIITAFVAPDSTDNLNGDINNDGMIDVLDLLSFTKHLEENTSAK